MDAKELLQLIGNGESSTVQFKERLPHHDSMAHEMIAFSNTRGGRIIIGVNDKTGALNGLSFDEIQQTNQQLVNIASQNIIPPIFITTETIAVDESRLIVVEIAEGISKPYKDRLGSIFLKNGSDKRRVTSNDEIARLLQSCGVIFADEAPVAGTSLADVDVEYYKSFISKKYNCELEELGIDLQRSLSNLNLMKDESLTLAGLLFFSNNRSKYRPLFSVQCVSVNDSSLIENNFTDYEYLLEGNLRRVFEDTISYIGRNIRKIPIENSFNSQTKWEIPYGVFEELIINALVHRDYFISASIKLAVYDDRIEIVSPGKLPNSLTLDNIKSGISIARNPILQTLAQHTLPYKGLGTGVMRAISMYPEIEFENDISKNQFKAVIKRP